MYPHHFAHVLCKNHAFLTMPVLMRLAMSRVCSNFTFFTVVYPSYMFVQMTLFYESFMADIACVGSLPTVYLHVSGQTSLIGKSFSTDFASVRSLPIVYHNVIN